MTGAFIRLQREGRYVNVDVAEMTDEELKAYFLDGDLEKVKLASWCKFLASWVRDHVRFRGDEPL